MSNVFSRACTLFVVFGGLWIGACGSPSGPGATPSATRHKATNLASRQHGTMPLGLTEASALSPGVTDVTLMNTGWACIAPNTRPNSLRTPRPGLSSVPPFPIMEEHRPTPSRHSRLTTSTTMLRFIRPDLYHGQPCQGGGPYTLFG